MSVRLPVVALLVGIGVAAGPASAATVPVVPSVKTRIAKVQINVSGYILKRELHDTTGNCVTGETWIQSNRYTFSTGDFVNISLKRITGEGFDPIVTSPFTRSAGRATVKGATTGYRTTSACPPSSQPRPEPACASTSGKTSISLQEGVVPKGDDESLTPLTSTPLLIVIRRVGGGQDPMTCAGGGAGELVGDVGPQSSATTSIAPGVAAILPSGFSVLKMFRIRPEQKLRRAIVLAGPCSSVTLKTVPAPGATPSEGVLSKDGDCFISGKIVYTIQPRPPED